jgi:hypothetical protein
VYRYLFPLVTLCTLLTEFLLMVPPQVRASPQFLDCIRTEDIPPSPTPSLRKPALLVLRPHQYLIFVRWSLHLLANAQNQI